jgi:fatty-acid desaturase
MRGAGRDGGRFEGPLVEPSLGRVRFDVVKALWLWGMLVPGAVVGLAVVTPGLVAVSLGLAFLTLCVGHSVGLHRGVIHDTYRARPMVRVVLAELFVLSGLGGPLSWARLHAVRDYWQSQPDCPRLFAYRHGLVRDFGWNLHLRYEAADDRALAKLPRGAATLDDAWLRFLEKTWPLHHLGLALVVLVVGGPDAVAVCVCSRTACGILGHWFVGYAAHAWGERRFVVEGATESGTNVWWLGVLSFGEGFHNNHHAHPWSARMGLRTHELDVGWLVLRALAFAHVVRDVRSPR